MSAMPTYMKAYPLKRLREFRGWTESERRSGRGVGPDADAGDAQTPRLTDDSVVFVHEDLTVTHGFFADEQVIFADVTPDWTRFCHDVLEFQVPDFEEESARVRREIAALEEKAAEKGAAQS